MISPAMMLVTTIGCGRISLGGGGDSSVYQLRTNRDVYNRGNTGEVAVRNVSDHAPLAPRDAITTRESVPQSFGFETWRTRSGASA